MISVWISLAQLPPRLPVSSGGPTIEKTSALDIQVAAPLGLKPVGQNTKQEMARQVR
jgi:hypothetical protein